jgi:putative radical SAM enzyme (TIGR03279 family)
MVVIKDIIKNSLADRAGIKPGRLLSINGFAINDILDYDYYNKEKNLTLVIESGEDVYTKSIINPKYNDLGLVFGTYLMSDIKSCRNKCIFCFIDQNPPGMRESCYFKDDDDRMSFLAGNYITLTNLSDADIDRIISMKLAINVSLHTTDPELRCRMMNNRFAGERIAGLRRIAAAGNKINIQIVLCKGINDGEKLGSTLDDLLEMGVEAVAVVPVGLTAYRDGLFPLQSIDAGTAAETIDIIEYYQSLFQNRTGRKTCYASDEFFIKAGRNIPSADYYDDYPQYENGVGFLRVFADEFLAELKANIGRKPKGSTIIVTGESAYPFISNLIDYAKKLFPDLKCEVWAIKNNFFGGGVSVTGLLVGSDIIEQLSWSWCKYDNLDTTILLSKDMFKADTELFLDNKTRKDVEEALQRRVEIIPRDGRAVFRRISGRQN